MEYRTCHLMYFLGIHMSLIPCCRKYSGQHNPCDIRTANVGKIGYNIIKYTTAFPVFRLAVFLWHGTKLYMYISSCSRKYPYHPYGRFKLLPPGKISILLASYFLSALEDPRTSSVFSMMTLLCGEYG